MALGSRLRSEGRRMELFAAALCLALSLCVWVQATEGLVALGPFGNAPFNRRVCPSACKVRDVSIIGNGTLVAAASADTCIRTCRLKGSSHYSWSQPSKLCSCGKCIGGYTRMSPWSNVISGSTAACVKQNTCSAFLPLAGFKSCPPFATQVQGKGWYKNSVKCCCKPPYSYPVVMGGSLKACSASSV